MRYTKLTGYDAITALEAEKCLQELERSFAGLGTEPLELTVVTPKGALPVRAQPGDTLAAVLERAGAAEEGQQVKAVHLGYPVGGIFGPQALEQPLSAALLTEKGLTAGSLEIHVLCDDTCLVDYMARLALTLRGESCGRCVFCREGLRQLHRILDDITRGRSGPDDLELIRVLADGMREGAHCLFGRAVGAAWLHAMDTVSGEFEAHIRRKRCAAMVCRKYISYHILGSKCQGCEKCLEVCPREAIEGEADYIHVIDQFECDKCGECVRACPHEAIVKAGAVKPKTPEEPIPVGSWRGR